MLKSDVTFLKNCQKLLGMLIALAFMAGSGFCFAAPQATLCEKPLSDFQYFEIKNFIPYGDAKMLNELVSITEDHVNRTGIIWYNFPLDYREAFSTTFSFMTRNGNNQFNVDGSLPGGDGYAFVMSAEKQTCGGAGGEIGYGGMHKAIAVEFDTYNNPTDYKDKDGNHIAVQVAQNKEDTLTSIHNTVNTLGLTNKIHLMKDFVMNYARIDYSPADKKLEIYFDTTIAFTQPALTIDSFKLDKYIDFNTNSNLYMGISAGTGVAVAKHYLHSFYICGTESIPLGVENETDVDKSNEVMFIFDTIGKKISDCTELNKHEVLSRLKEGMYFITDSNGNLINKLIKTINN